MTAPTDIIAELRTQLAEVLERHHDSYYLNTTGRPMCGSKACGADWPCDAANMARQMTTLLDGLEFYADEGNYCLKSRGLDVNGLVIGYDDSDVELDMGERAQQAIASAAQEQEGNDDR